jgi:hypothetical protein
LNFEFSLLPTSNFYLMDSLQFLFDPATCWNIVYNVYLQQSGGCQLGLRQRSIVRVNEPYFRRKAVSKFLLYLNHTDDHSDVTELWILLGSLALFDGTLRSRSGLSGCEITLWISDTVLSCKTSSDRTAFPTANAEKVLVVSLGFRIGTLTTSLTFDSVLASSIFPGNHAMSGIRVITLAGSGISLGDTSVQMRYGETSVERTGWFSDSAVAGKIALSFRTGSSRAVITSGSFGSATSAGTYHSASVSRMSRSNLGQSRMVTIVGSIFSPRFITLHARWGFTACRSTSWTSSSSIFCRTPDGAYSSRKFTATIHLSTSSISRVHSFDLPYLSRTVQNTPTSGSSSITLTGVSIRYHLGSSPAARLGFSASQTSVWISDTSLTSKISAGILKSKKSHLTSGGTVGSSTQSWSYHAPVFGIQRESPGISTVLIVNPGRNYVDGLFELATGKKIL